MYIISILYTMPICDPRKHGTAPAHQSGRVRDYPWNLRLCPSPRVIAEHLTTCIPWLGHLTAPSASPSLGLVAPLTGHPDTATATTVAHPVTTAQATKWRLADHHNIGPFPNCNYPPKISQTTRRVDFVTCMYTHAHIRRTCPRLRFAHAHPPALAHCSRYHNFADYGTFNLISIDYRSIASHAEGGMGGYGGATAKESYSP